jgi:hypothetical protein
VGGADAVRVLGFGFWEQGTPEVVVLLDRAGDREEVFEHLSLPCGFSVGSVVWCDRKNNN